MTRPLLAAATLLALALAPVADAAACLNKFMRRSEGAKQIVTILTGKLTFQEAQALKGNSIEWVDEKGKPIARTVDVKAVRPMPVGCDGKTSGTVVIATFLTMQQPKGKMFVKLDGAAAVQFEEQAQ